MGYITHFVFFLPGSLTSSYFSWVSQVMSQKNIQVMDDHDLVVKAMMTWDLPWLKKPLI